MLFGMMENDVFILTRLWLDIQNHTREFVMQHIHISKWGNSLGFRIPRGIADSLDIKGGGTRLSLSRPKKSFW
jgi:hypothetical protein